jgi:alkyl sulfatase BDS1-like metallo-beta-lactamase superfamily hydrolase
MQLRRLTVCLLVALTAAAANLHARTSTSPTAAPQAPPAEPLSIHLIKGGVYWTRGGAGGNTGFIVGKDGVIVFDAKMTPDSAKEMLAAIAKITAKP